MFVKVPCRENTNSTWCILINIVLYYACNENMMSFKIMKSGIHPYCEKKYHHYQINKMQSERYYIRFEFPSSNCNSLTFIHCRQFFPGLFRDQREYFLPNFFPPCSPILSCLFVGFYRLEWKGLGRKQGKGGGWTASTLVLGCLSGWWSKVSLMSGGTGAPEAGEEVQHWALREECLAGTLTSSSPRPLWYGKG